MLRTIPVVTIVAFCLLVGSGGRATAQSTWTGNASTTDWFTAGNWNPNSAFPGVANAGTANSDWAQFDTAGSTIQASNLNSGFSVGTISTTATGTGGAVTVNFTGNGQFQVNGGNTVAGFTNTVLAAQGRDLIIIPTNMQFGFGTTGQTSTFYADAGRTIFIGTQQFTNNGGDFQKTGAGTLVLNAKQATVTDDFGAANTLFSINGGTVAIDNTVNNLPNMNVATGATLQPGLTVGSSLSVSNKTIQFANNAQLKILTDGSSVN